VERPSRATRYAALSSYIFVHLALSARLRTLEVPGVVRLIGFNGQPYPLPASEIEALRTGIMNAMRIEPHRLLNAGCRVRIKSGPLAGTEGILVRKKNVHRVVLTISANRTICICRSRHSWDRKDCLNRGQHMQVQYLSSTSHREKLGFLKDEQRHPKSSMVAISASFLRVRQAAFSIADQAFFVGGTFLANVILARTQTKEEYGMFVLSYSVFTFLTGLTQCFNSRAVYGVRVRKIPHSCL